MKIIKYIPIFCLTNAFKGAGRNLTRFIIKKYINRLKDKESVTKLKK